MMAFKYLVLRLLTLILLKLYEASLSPLENTLVIVVTFIIVMIDGFIDLKTRS